MIKQGVPLSSVVDFSAFRPEHCQQVLDIIAQVKAAGLLVPGKKLKYVFISTDSTYDASAYLLDQHSHKFIPPGFLKPDQASKPKLNKDSKSNIYQTSYDAAI